MDLKHIAIISLTTFVSLIPSIPSMTSANPDPSSFSELGLKDSPLLKNYSLNDRLRKNVGFWIQIYSQYSTHQGLIHDAKYIDHVYEVVDFTHHGTRNTHWIRNEKLKWRKILLSLDQKEDHPEQMTLEEKRVFDLFRDINEPHKFLNAAHRKRLRFQLGQKDVFLEGFYQSGLYLPWMEKVFKDEGVPTELTRLPYVESSFNLKARSKVGASGIWQFMRYTAGLFLKINPAIDERNDPIRESAAAARLLKLNYESLGNWPLAVTAYNHGRKGVMKATRRVGTNRLGQVITEFHARSFGFASSNFFAELLAAIEVDRNASQYFKNAERVKSVDFVEVKIPDYIAVQDIGRQYHLDLKILRELNPALTDEVFSGRLLVPAGYLFRFPVLTDSNREVALKHYTDVYAQIPVRLKRREQKVLR